MWAPSSSWMGLIPRKAANRLPMGERWEMDRAAAVGTPWAVRPENRAWGRAEARPRVMRVKKNPMDSTLAEFWKVLSMPPPAPRWLAGRLFITRLVLGGANSPGDSPKRGAL